MARRISPFARVGLYSVGKGRYYNEQTDQTISRRQATKLLGRDSFETAAKKHLQESPTTQAARPAPGRPSARYAKLTPSQVQSRTRALAKKRKTRHAAGNVKSKPKVAKTKGSYFYKARGSDNHKRFWVVDNVGELEHAYKTFSKWAWVYAYYLEGLFEGMQGSNRSQAPGWFNIQPTRLLNNPPSYHKLESLFYHFYYSQNRNWIY